MVREGCDYQHQVVRELGLMVWPTKSESPINVVRGNKPKVLIGLNQKVCGPEQALADFLPQARRPPAKRRGLTHLGACDTRSRLQLLRLDQEDSTKCSATRPYRGVRPERSGGAKPSEQCSLTREGGNLIVREGCDCQHRGGRELGLMVWPTKSEPPINVVKFDKPKMLIGLNQNGMWSGIGVPTSPSADETTTGEQAGPNPSGCIRGTW
jgi:hypothetical protein